MRVAADALTIALCVALLALLAKGHIGGPTRLAPPMPETHVHLDGVDFGAAPQTLIMALRSDCVFCQESMPFYRRLLARDTVGTQVVVAAPARDVGINAYLASQAVVPDAILLVPPGGLPLYGTPSLIMVDPSGAVIDAWIGLLDAEQEAEVLAAL
jgi:hypothetical protein